VGKGTQNAPFPPHLGTPSPRHAQACDSSVLWLVFCNNGAVADVAETLVARPYYWIEKLVL
jgi:hypothetical protein